MRFDIRSFLRGLLALVGFLVLGCDNSVSPNVSTTAAVHVTVSTAGASQNLDPDGYALRLDSDPYHHLALNDTASLSGVAAGTHMVRLDGVATNCVVDGTNPRRVDVENGTLTYAVTFSVQCLGTTGSVRISTVTTGENPDANGYVANLGDVGTFEVAANGTRTITGVKLGTVGISLSDVAGNCAVDNPRSPIVQVVNDSTVNTAFFVRCVAAGSLEVTTTTDGVDPDPNGYGFYLQLEGGYESFPFSTAANATTNIPSLLPGNYLLYPVDVAANCNPAMPAPRKYPSRQASRLQFSSKSIASPQRRSPSS
jgi:hypothetical protein